MTHFKLTVFVFGLMAILLSLTTEVTCAKDIASHGNVLSFMIGNTPQASIATGWVAMDSATSINASTTFSTSTYSPIGIPKPTGEDPFPIVPPTSIFATRSTTATTSVSSVTETSTALVTSTSMTMTSITDTITSVTASVTDTAPLSTSTQVIYTTASIGNGHSQEATSTVAQTTQSGAENNPTENGTSSKTEWYDKEGRKTFLLSMFAAVIMHVFG